MCGAAPNNYKRNIAVGGLALSVKYLGKFDEEDETDPLLVQVTHELEDFQEGEQAILTLADERVINADGTLNEDMDMLEDITKMDAFKLVKFVLAHVFRFHLS